jgi:hypothetical protein
MAILLLILVLAAGDEQLAGDDVVPIICREPGHIVEKRRDSNSDEDLARRLAMTSCAARERMNGLVHLRASDISRIALEVAVAPTLAELDEIERVGAPGWQILVEQLRGDLYMTMAVRLRSAPSDDTTEQTASHVTGWLMRAGRAYAAVRRIAAEHPDALDDPRVSSAAAASAPMLVR